MAFQSDVIVVESVRIPIYRGDAAGGDLTGTYPNPEIAAGAVTQSKLATNSVGTNELQDGSVTAAKLVSITSLGIFPISDPSYIGSGIVTNAHIGGAAAIATSKLAEGHRFINDYENQLVSGIKFFSRAPRTSYVPLTNYDLVNKRYVDLRLLSGTSSSVGNGGGNVSGNGAANYLAKFISANRISTTIVYDAGNQVAVGTTSFNSTDRFTVSGNIAIVDGRMVGQNIISGNNIGAGNIQFGHLASNSVQNSTILNASISGNKIQALSVLEGHLANNVVTNGKLALASVSGNVIQSRSIQQGHLALESVSGNIIGTDSIQQGHIADSAIGTNELINLSVTNGKLALASVSGNVIQSKAILNGHLALGSVSGNVLGTDVVLQGHIADNAVGTNEIIDANVTTAKLANLSVTNGKLALASVSGNVIQSKAILNGHLALESVSGNVIGTDVILQGHLANDSVGTNEIIDANVTTAKLANLSVTNGKLALASVSGNVIQSKAILNGHLALESVSGNVIGTDIILQGHLANDSVGTNEIIDANVTTAKLANLSVTNGKLALASVSGNVIQSKAILNGHLALESVSGNVIGTDVILQGHIADNAVGTNEIIDANITTAKIANLAVTNGKLALASVSGNVIQSKAILNGHLALESVSGNVIATDSIQQGHIANDAVGTNEIIDLNVTTAKLANLSVTNGKIAHSAISGNVIQSKAILNGHIADAAISGNLIGAGAILQGHLGFTIAGSDGASNRRTITQSYELVSGVFGTFLDRGHAVYYSSLSGSYLPARSDHPATAEAIGVIESVSGNSFVLVTAGLISGTRFNQGDVYYLTHNQRGVLTSTVVSGISKPILIGLDPNYGHVKIDRGIQITDTPVTTSGTAGFIVKYTSPTTYANSIMQESAQNVTVNGGLIVSGTTQIGGNLVVQGINITGTAGSVTLPAASISGNYIAAGAILPGHMGFDVYKKNYIINGDFKIWQRLSGLGFTSVSTEYIADMWKFGKGTDGGAFNIRREERIVPENTKYSMKIEVATADAANNDGEVLWVLHRIEGLEIIELKDEYVTFSFWMRGNLTGTYPVIMRTTSGTRAFAKNVTLNAADTWEQKIVTFPIDNSQGFTYTNTASLDIYISLSSTPSVHARVENQWHNRNALGTSSGVDFGATAGNYLYLGNAQLEIGSGICTSFKREHYSETLSKCQRYLYVYERSGDNNYFATGLVYSSTGCIPLTPTPVPMRTQPSLVATASQWNLIDGKGGGGAATTFALYSVGTTDIRSNIIALDVQTTAGGMTTGTCGQVYGIGPIGARVILSAEL